MGLRGSYDTVFPRVLKDFGKSPVNSRVVFPFSNRCGIDGNSNDPRPSCARLDGSDLIPAINLLKSHCAGTALDTIVANLGIIPIKRVLQRLPAGLARRHQGVYDLSGKQRSANLNSPVTFRPALEELLSERVAWI